MFSNKDAYESDCKVECAILLLNNSQTLQCEPEVCMREGEECWNDLMV